MPFGLSVGAEENFFSEGDKKNAVKDRLRMFDCRQPREVRRLVLQRLNELLACTYCKAHRAFL